MSYFVREVWVLWEVWDVWGQRRDREVWLKGVGFLHQGQTVSQLAF
ncbi:MULTISPECIES: hypothetical protein [Moorena]|uniref:Uncharacterized protein n=1 Tax=Moorena producens (strain JHB) TaxID=1454205 RepID=A0A9Q9UVU3_MOOP1|nr:MULTISPECIES: hypothetical protein [Moorena]NEQ13548.1 hypothetical protein [Moorena sp. SIO3E2]NER88188.1 hypothetical protein [Moorena sp. SIO3A2]WAN69166.1 hypothetical protein BJP36_43185 [Moorena producens JHB]